MMILQTTINFLAKKQAEYQRRAKRLLVIQGAAFAILGVYILLIGGVFAYSLYLTNQKKQLEGEIQQVSSQIQKQSAMEAKYVFIKTKLKALVPVLASQRKNQDLMAAVLTLLPPGVSVKNFTVNEDGKISFSAEVADFQTFNRLLTNLKKGEVTPKVRMQLAKIGSLNLSSDGNYGFNVILELVTKGE